MKTSTAVRCANQHPPSHPQPPLPPRLRRGARLCALRHGPKRRNAFLSAWSEASEYLLDTAVSGRPLVFAFFATDGIDDLVYPSAGSTSAEAQGSSLAVRSASCRRKARCGGTAGATGGTGSMVGSAPVGPGYCWGGDLHARGHSAKDACFAANCRPTCLRSAE